MTIVNPLLEAANWFLAFYSTIPPAINWLCTVVIVNFLTVSLVRMLMRM